VNFLFSNTMSFKEHRVKIIKYFNNEYNKEELEKLKDNRFRFDSLVGAISFARDMPNNQKDIVVLSKDSTPDFILIRVIK